MSLGVTPAAGGIVDILARRQVMVYITFEAHNSQNPRQLLLLSEVIFEKSCVRVRSLQFACQVELHAPAEENNPTNIGLLKVKGNQVKGKG
jgi:hypothetical protein